MNLTNVNNNNNILKMTSLQIAEMLGKRHDNVKSSIKTLISKGIISEPVEQDGIRSANGTIPVVYVFEGEAGKRDSIIAIAQLSPQHTAILVDRWIELEKQVASPAFKIPTSLGEALRLAADQQDIIEAQLEQVSILENKVEEDKHKVRFFENTGNSQKLHSLTDAGSAHGISAQAVSKVLEEYSAFNMKNVTQKTYKIGFINQGLGEMKIRQSGHTQPMLTTKGCQWLDAKLYEDKGIAAIKEHYAKAKKLPTVYEKNLKAILNPVETNTARLEHTEATIQTINNLLK